MKTLHHNYDVTIFNIILLMWYDAFGKLEPAVAPGWAKMFFSTLAVLAVSLFFGYCV